MMKKLSALGESAKTSANLKAKEQTLLAYSIRLLDETRQEIVRAENKASVLLAATLAGGGGAIGALAAGNITISELDARIQWLAWAGILLFLAGSTELFRAIAPRLGDQNSGRTDYFQDFLRTPEELESLLQLDLAEQRSRHIRQLARLSEVVATKYLSIKRSLLLVSMGSILMLVVGYLADLLRH